MNEPVRTISVVIPTFNRRDSLRRALLAIAAQSFPKHAYEVVVAVDGSVDGTTEMLCHLKMPYRLRVTEQEHCGTAAARNLAASIAEGDLLLSLDDDIIAHPDLISTHVAWHAQHPEAVVLGQMPLHPEARLSAFARYKHRRFEGHFRKMGQPSYTPDFRDCLTGNLSIRRQYLQLAGGFDQDFRDYNHEDTELGYRLQSLGMKLHYVPQAIGYHLYSKTFIEGCYDSYGDGRSSVMLMRKHPQVERFLPAGRGSIKPRLAPLARVLTSGPLPDIHRLICALDRGRRVVGFFHVGVLLHLYFSLSAEVCYWQGVRDERRGGYPALMAQGSRNGAG